MHGDDLVDFVLDRGVFENGLDDPVRLAQPVMVFRGHVDGRDPPGPGQGAQAVLDGGVHGLPGVPGKIEQGNVKSLVAQVAGDLPAHHAGAEDSYFLR